MLKLSFKNHLQGSSLLPYNLVANLKKFPVREMTFIQRTQKRLIKLLGLLYKLFPEKLVSLIWHYIGILILYWFLKALISAEAFFFCSNNNYGYEYSLYILSLENWNGSTKMEYFRFLYCGSNCSWKQFKLYGNTEKYLKSIDKPRRDLNQFTIWA